MWKEEWRMQMRFSELEKFYKAASRFRPSPREAARSLVYVGIITVSLLAHFLTNIQEMHIRIPTLVAPILFVAGSFMYALHIHRFNQELSFLIIKRVRTTNDRWQARMKLIKDSLRSHLQSKGQLNRDAIQALLQLTDRTLATAQPLISSMTTRLLSIGLVLLLGGVTYLAKWQLTNHGLGSAHIFIEFALELFLLLLGMSFIVPLLISSLDLRRNRLRELGMLINEIQLDLLADHCLLEIEKEDQDQQP